MEEKTSRKSFVLTWFEANRLPRTEEERGKLRFKHLRKVQSQYRLLQASERMSRRIGNLKREVDAP